MNTRNSQSETIVAAATAPGKAGVGVVRISGDLAPAIARRLLGQIPEPRRAALASFNDASGESIDTGLALYFPAPHSYTGEHVIELQGHGSPVVMDALIKRICELGARPAEPGEYSKRAFLNDKMDLAQAEAVADLIDSGSRQAARAAMRSLSGAFSDAVNALTLEITNLRVHVEAAIDFPEEEIDFLDDTALRARVVSVRARFDELQRQARAGRALNDGLTIVLAGEPNVGKSSLLNVLVGDDAAIVTDIAGTTRDLIRESVVIDGLPVTLIDTAGLRETDDVVEREGVRRTRRAIAEADHALLMVDANDRGRNDTLASLLEDLAADVAATAIANKVDLMDSPDRPDSIYVAGRRMELLWVSARNGEGIEELRRYLHRLAGLEEDMQGSYSARRRHLLLLEDARARFDTAVQRLEIDQAGELMAEELRLCQQSLGGITGIVTSDDLLGKIFGEFCIGK